MGQVPTNEQHDYGQICLTYPVLGADEVAERSPWRVPERWSLVTVVTADVAEQSSSLDVARSC